ncbi:MAG: hypothetical protein H7Y30_08025 [Pyrinomonadaceae bacterium]|nr:hypothetical protein [Pyrinomonadaceae bacterium]
MSQKNVKPTIYLALVDDWELRGDGSGDMERIQFQSMRELVRIFNAHGIKGSFNAEVMQQLSFRKFEGRRPELKRLADEWDAVALETFRQGHDVQLHVHPQWREAQYENGKWLLTADWSILKHDPQDAYRMMETCKEYLEKLLRPIDPHYRCISFRSGAWCIAPSPHILRLLVRLGIVFDMSIVGGAQYDTRHVQLDYTNCEEDFLPYYPVMEDARKVSRQKEEIICVPTNQFYSSRRYIFKKQLGKVRDKVKARLKPAPSVHDNQTGAQNYYQEWAEANPPTSKLRRIFQNSIVPYKSGYHLISDISLLDYELLGEMLESIRRRARATGLSEVPIILENHTKDLTNFSHIERFAADLARAADIKCVTLTQLGRELADGRFFIKTSRT